MSVKTVENEGLYIEGYGSFSKETIQYYFDKYFFFKRQGLFKQNSTNNSFSYISPERIRMEFIKANAISFEVTDRCNLNCVYCTYGELYNNYDKRPGKNLTFSRVKNLLDFWFDLKKQYYGENLSQEIVISFYGGEPLLNIELIKKTVSYVERNKPKKLKSKYSITTNGVLLRKHIEYLVNHDFILMISLDGNEFNNSYRLTKKGKSSFHTVLENSLLIKKQFPQYFEKKVKFNAVLHNRNTINELYLFFKSTFEKEPLISSLAINGVNNLNETDFSKIYRSIEDSMIDIENRNIDSKSLINPDKYKLEDTLYSLSGYFFNNYNHLINFNKKTTRCPTGTCIPFSRDIFLTVNGKILPCVMIGQEYGLGFVDEYVNIDFQDIAKKINKMYDQLVPKCKTCYNSSNCNQCIFQLELSEINNTSTCKSYMNYNKQSNYLSDRISYIENNPEVYKDILTNFKIDATE